MSYENTSLRYSALFVCKSAEFSGLLLAELALHFDCRMHMYMHYPALNMQNLGST